MGKTQPETLLVDETGASAIEYVLIAMFIALGVMVAITSLGVSLHQSLLSMCNAVSTVVGTGGC